MRKLIEVPLLEPGEAAPNPPFVSLLLLILMLSPLIVTFVLEYRTGRLTISSTFMILVILMLVVLTVVPRRET